MAGWSEWQRAGGYPVRPMRKRLTAKLAVVTAAAMVAAGCSSSDGGSSGVPQIAVTTSIWADVVSNVACGGSAEITTIMPPGADPHSYEPSLADRALLADADLVVVNGFDLEESLLDTLDSLGDDKLIFYFSDHVAAPVSYTHLTLPTIYSV